MSNRDQIAYVPETSGADMPCAAMPSRMLPGPIDRRVVFPTCTDRILFEEALNMQPTSDEQSLVDALHKVYGVAAALLPTCEEIDYAGECAVYFFKGVVSPLAAIVAVQRRESGSGYAFRARHVMLRYSVDSRLDYDRIITDGHVNGRGGSFPATIVEPRDVKTWYSTPAATEPRGYHMSEWAAKAWEQFVKELTGC